MNRVAIKTQAKTRRTIFVECPERLVYLASSFFDKQAPDSVELWPASVWRGRGDLAHATRQPLWLDVRFGHASDQSATVDSFVLTLIILAMVLLSPGVSGINRARFPSIIVSTTSHSPQLHTLPPNT